MAGPIPVFSFVFAAYAATSTGKAHDAKAHAAKNLAPGAPFRTAWRLHFARGAAVYVKIRIVRGSKPRELRLAVNSSGEAGEDLWVSGILEAGLGFVGAPVDPQQRPQHLAEGQHIHFHVINVLEWRIGDCPKASCAFPGEPEFEPPFFDTANP